MKRVIAIVLTGLLTIGVYSVGCLPEKEVEEPQQVEIVETKTIEYLTDFELSKLYTLKKDQRKREAIDLTQDEADLLLKVGRSEGGDTVLGQAMVMRVLLNRIESDNPDFQGIETIGQVVFQSNQFEVVSTGAYKKADVNVNSHLALALCEQGWDESGGALWFESKSNSDESWHKRNLTFICEIEGNLYYK